MVEYSRQLYGGEHVGDDDDGGDGSDCGSGSELTPSYQPRKKCFQ